MTGATRLRVSFNLNGQPIAETVEPQVVLADILRDRHNLKGLKIGCDQAVCGACTVLVDCQPIAACATFVFSLEGKDVRTIEGLAGKDGLHPVQQAFKDNSAFQCGYCTPGMILLAVALLKRNPSPTREEITDWMSANICRCTGYRMIVEAVEKAAGTMATAG